MLVFAHHPPNDPQPAKNSQLVDRREAAMVERWLSEFSAESGKAAAYIGGTPGPSTPSRSTACRTWSSATWAKAGHDAGGRRVHRVGDARRRSGRGHGRQPARTARRPGRLAAGRDQAPRDAVAALDPAAGTITGLRAGTATITVTVNGDTATAEVAVARTFVPPCCRFAAGGLGSARAAGPHIAAPGTPVDPGVKQK